MLVTIQIHSFEHTFFYYSKFIEKYKKYGSHLIKLNDSLSHNFIVFKNFQPIIIECVKSMLESMLLALFINLF